MVPKAEGVLKYGQNHRSNFQHEKVSFLKCIIHVHLLFMAGRLCKCLAVVGLLVLFLVLQLLEQLSTGYELNVSECVIIQELLQ